MLAFSLEYRNAEQLKCCCLEFIEIVCLSAAERVSWIKPNPTCSDWKQKPQVRKLFSSAHHLSPSASWFEFFIVLLKLIYDVSKEPLSQNRIKTKSLDQPACAFNLDTPSTPQAFFQVHSTAPMPQNCFVLFWVSFFFPHKLLWKSKCLWSLLSSIVFCFLWSIYWLTGYWW